MSLTDLEDRKLQWRKAKRSAGNGACIEVASVDGQIAVRDSMNPGGGRLQYPPYSWQAFVSTVKDESIFEK
jgi:Domain of unknown function (DUF397)